MSLPVSGAIFSASIRRAVFRPESEKFGSVRPCIGRGQGEALGISLRGLALHMRPARIAQAQQLGDLVEGLADGVVDGGAEAHIVADAAHRDELRMAAGGEQQQIGEADAVGEPRGERMGLEMVHRHQGLAGDERDGLGGGEPHQHAADQAGAGRHRDAVEILDGAVRVLQRRATTRRSMTSTWARAAISGTTPP